MPLDIFKKGLKTQKLGYRVSSMDAFPIFENVFEDF